MDKVMRVAVVHTRVRGLMDDVHRLRHETEDLDQEISHATLGLLYTLEHMKNLIDLRYKVPEGGD